MAHQFLSTISPADVKQSNLWDLEKRLKGERKHQLGAKIKFEFTQNSHKQNWGLKQMV